jgi:hypothetical protein
MHLELFLDDDVLVSVVRIMLKTLSAGRGVRCVVRVDSLSSYMVT